MGEVALVGGWVHHMRDIGAGVSHRDGRTEYSKFLVLGEGRFDCSIVGFGRSGWMSEVMVSVE
jgi:hypothetical protein